MSASTSTHRDSRVTASRTSHGVEDTPMTASNAGWWLPEEPTRAGNDAHFTPAALGM